MIESVFHRFVLHFKLFINLRTVDAEVYYAVELSWEFRAFPFVSRPLTVFIKHVRIQIKCYKSIISFSHAQPFSCFHDVKNFIYVTEDKKNWKRNGEGPVDIQKQKT